MRDMELNNSNLLKMEIKWTSHPSNPRYYYSKINQHLVLLRINNFPDESMYSLINGLDILDFDDSPSQWQIPHQA